MVNRYVEQSIKIVSPIIPFTVVKNLVGTNLMLPSYHTVSDEDLSHVKHLYPYKNTTEFRKALDFFLQHYTPICLSELLEHINKGSGLPDNAFFLTFDDGFRESYDVIAPILKEKGIPATFFLVTNWIDNKMLFYRHKASVLIEALRKSGNPNLLEKVKAVFLSHDMQVTDFEAGILAINYYQQQMLDEIALVLEVDFDDYLIRNKPYLDCAQIHDLIEAGFTIGAHSVDHPLYSMLPLEDQLYQTRESVRYIKEKFSLNYGAFAFPYNDKGVSKKYFETTFGQDGVDISFGTSSMRQDVYPNSLQRTEMETIPLSARDMISVRYSIKLARRMFGDKAIRRN
ncbi:MAG: polysaccharide deacetylase family protein [Anaerolineae bacterium]|nr:polysaccharide deacetylase family protein [Anaerolineae bacterium]